VVRRKTFAPIGFLALVLGLSVLPLSLPARAALAPAPLFQALSGFVPVADDVRVAPEEFYAVRADQTSLRQALATSEISLPDPEGVMRRFAISRSPIMEPQLAAAHPEIQTYAGRGLDDQTSTIRLDLTPMGLHASVRRPGGTSTWYIDPAYNARGTSTYLSYYGASLPEPAEEFIERELEVPESAPAQTTNANRPGPGDEVKLHTYRLALVTDPTYATYFGTENVLAEKVTLVNRVNQVYNDDAAIRLVLVNGTDELNLDTAEKATGANGPCGVDACYTATDLQACTGSTLNRTAWALGQLVGADAFDVGHIGLGVNGGGVAGLGVVGEQNKAQGCTGITTPEGDLYAVDYVAHELGHQFSGRHTFNGTQVSCSLTNRSGATSVEPGSGSSVMAYAGICGQDDLQPHSDPYLSQRTIDEFTAQIEYTPLNYVEMQTISLGGFDVDGETVTLTFPGHDPVVVTRGAATYTNATVQQAILDLTGYAPTVVGYHGAASVNDGGFQLTFGSGSGAQGINVPTIGVTPGAGVDRAFTGVQIQGGPGTNQGTVTSSGNHAPSVTAAADKTLPLRTPFALTASGSDVDGDALIYLWEQNDVGGPGSTDGTALVSNTKADGPLFRVFGVHAPVTSEGTLQSPSPGENLADGTTTRVFPDLAQVLADNTNAKTGTCPAAPADTGVAVPIPVVECYAEFLPTVDYGNALHFRVTARDQAPEGGGTAYDDVTLTLDSAAGPFLVTSHSTAATVVGGSTSPVTWDVAGTNTESLATQVRILLSTDGGLTWPTVLHESTPNDGTADVTWPQVDTSEARIRIEAVGNYFFDINDVAFPIKPAVTITGAAARTAQYSDPLSSPLAITATSEVVDADQLTATIAGVDGLTISPLTATGDGIRPSVATFAVGGVALADVGERIATVTVTPAGYAARETTVPVTITPEDLVVTPYAGQTSYTAGTYDQTIPVSFDLSASDPADGHPGDVTTATARMLDGASQLCPATAFTTAPAHVTCQATLAAPAGDSTHPIAVQIGGNYTIEPGSSDFQVVVHRTAGVDSPKPTITSGPAANSIVKPSSVRFTYALSAPGSVSCALDAKPIACGATGVTLQGIKPGTHVFRVYARPPGFTQGPYSVARRWVRPFDDRALTVKRGTWRALQVSGAYLGTIREARATGARLQLDVSKAVRVDLLVQKLPGGGSVRLYLGTRLVKTVSVAATTRRFSILHFGSLTTPFTGALSIVTTSGRPVRIDGLAVLTNAPG